MIAAVNMWGLLAIIPIAFVVLFCAMILGSLAETLVTYLLTRYHEWRDSKNGTA